MLFGHVIIYNESPFVTCHSYDLYWPSLSVSEKRPLGEHSPLSIEVFSSVFVMASVLDLSKDSTKEDIMDLLKEKEFHELIDAFKGKPS